uniref:Uncharacterized protein n=1 Tax=Timema cristinae TaxID=61476 RepID=A0A7R9CBV4_TIMCR|nr:unnamed protein product [Timema cristinae]
MTKHNKTPGGSEQEDTWWFGARRPYLLIIGGEWRKLKMHGICRTKTSRLSCTQDLSKADKVLVCGNPVFCIFHVSQQSPSFSIRSELILTTTGNGMKASPRGKISSA